MSSGEKYVAAAYLVVFAFVLVYVLIIGLKLQRLQRELAELAARARARRVEDEALERREVTQVG